MPPRMTRPRSERESDGARILARRDLCAIAEVAYHYQRCGGFDLARTIFEGLAAIDPAEPYFAVALGLVSDHLGDRESAVAWYSRARELDPSDGRPDVNLAELAFAEGNRARASSLLRSGAEKARARGDAALERKAHALLEIALGPAGILPERAVLPAPPGHRNGAASRSQEKSPEADARKGSARKEVERWWL